MTRYIFTVLLISSLPMATLIGQNYTLTEAQNIKEMMDMFVELNKEQSLVEGWRIQILATPDRIKLEETKQNFQFKYPNIPLVWEHSRPYYKLRAGAFATRLEAVRLLYLLKKNYPSAYLAKDKKIRPEELVGTY